MRYFSISTVRRKLLKPPNDGMKSRSMELLPDDDFQIPNHTPISFGHHDIEPMQNITIKGPRKRQIEDVLQARKELLKKDAPKL